ncbi:selR domain-containing protein, putative [Eimeria mitis]|uniref:SelR domain-containing protein, putative n=1 Tax=Eimeria mitis TaxID=44415 RepID=U6K948_9EIME|nr:selR domain-containing protein, putative [Eimeria mitis]CDJ31998.1 selR domain-containing protein, putative [Eimeria mitis]
MASSTFQQKTEEEWRQTLTREEYRVLREKATEPAGSGEYDRFTPSSGCFVCRGCLSPLFPASSKFKSGCGWPAFDRAYKGKVKAVLDLSGGMRGCLSPLFPASSKFKSGCGWPAFDRAYKGKVKAVLDLSGGMRRWEIICSTCGGHLGHVFNGERFTDTNERHCVNSLSIKYMENEPSPPLETEVLNPEK